MADLGWGILAQDQNLGSLWLILLMASEYTNCWKCLIANQRLQQYEKGMNEEQYT